MKAKRVFILIFDMLAGHWREGSTVPATGLPPPNVMGYAAAGKLPEFKECMETGVFAYSWNMGVCRTSYGQKYLASGTYDIEIKPGKSPYNIISRGRGRETILYACKDRHPEGKVGAFGSDAWMQSGWWKAPDATYGWGSYFSDFLTAQTCLNWLASTPGWKAALLYLAQYDKTGNCPVYREGAAYMEDKHHSILYLDRILWMVKNFLKESGLWDETLLFIGSDHGCHYGCEVSVREGREEGITGAGLENYCGNHLEPHDCRLWDFRKDAPSGEKINCARRTVFIISGGALPAGLRENIIPRCEITDFAPTIAKLMDIEFSCDGKSLA